MTFFIFYNTPPPHQSQDFRVGPACKEDSAPFRIALEGVAAWSGWVGGGIIEIMPIIEIWRGIWEQSEFEKLRGTIVRAVKRMMVGVVVKIMEIAFGSKRSLGVKETMKIGHFWTEVVPTSGWADSGSHRAPPGLAGISRQQRGRLPSKNN